MFNQLRKLFHWVLHWAETPYGLPALSVLAFVESSFFPIPPDPLLLALAIGKPKESFRYGFYCTVFSVLGGMFGYMIGFFIMETVGFPILKFYGAMGEYETIQALYRNYDAWAVGIAGLSPLPYKVFTIAAGAFEINFVVFVLASFVSRGVRFMFYAVLVWKYGPSIKKFIEKYFEIFVVGFIALIVGGFILLKFIV